RYSFGWLILPVLAFLALYISPRRVVNCLVALAVFAAVLAPWLVRNYQVSGRLFGLAGYAVYEETGSLTGKKMENSLEPDFSKTGFFQFRQKLLGNSRSIVQQDLFKLGGSWVTAFFLTGLLVPFKRPILGQLRMFLLLSL